MEYCTRLGATLFVEEVNDPLPLVEAIQCGLVTHSPSLKHAAENV